MPVTPTYPGVYIEEIPSGVRTIVGVPTSITAFVGRALRGPVNESISINNYGDFERSFGGLWSKSSLGFAVRDFYSNGGSAAIIVRLYKPEDNAKETAVLNANGLSLKAVSPGAWGNNLRAIVTHDDANDPILQQIAEGYGLTTDDLFNLRVQDTATGFTEEFRNLAVQPGPRQVDEVLKAESLMVRFDGSTLPQSRPDAHSAPQPGEDEWKDNNPATNSKVEPDDRASDGVALDQNSFTGQGTEANKQGLYALEQADLFNLLCIPPYLASGDVDQGLISQAAVYCEKRRAMLLVDPPSNWNSKRQAKDGINAGVGTNSKNAAIYFPRLKQPNPLRENRIEEFVPCGAIAGLYARTDAARGVWKAPAGIEATLNGVPELEVTLTDPENGELNPLGVNCLRSFPGVGRVVWGARTLQGNDRLASEWKYVPVRRLALYLEESLYRGTQWVVFEPNDEPLWAQIRLNVGAFMNNLFRQGAFQGSTPREAYLVKCDSETTTQYDIDRGVVNVLIGFAPLKPAEFVILKFQQLAGQLET